VRSLAVTVIVAVCAAHVVSVVDAALAPHGDRRVAREARPLIRALLRGLRLVRLVLQPVLLVVCDGGGRIVLLLGGGRVGGGGLVLGPGPYRSPRQRMSNKKQQDSIALDDVASSTCQVLHRQASRRPRLAS
jgi:hypothetical protein